MDGKNPEMPSFANSTAWWSQTEHANQARNSQQNLSAMYHTCVHVYMDIHTCYIYMHTHVYTYICIYVYISHRQKGAFGVADRRGREVVAGAILHLQASDGLEA